MNIDLKSFFAGGNRLPLLGGLIGAMVLLGLALGAGDSLVIGVIVGLVYGIIATGLVIIYKGSRVVNFAHGQMATLGTFAAWGLLTNPTDVPGIYVRSTLPWVLAALAGIAAGAASGVVIEGTVIRRLFRAPRLIVLVATLGIGQLIFLAIYLIWLRGADEAGATRIFPTWFQVSWRVGDVVILGEHVLAAVVVPVVCLGLAGFFKLSRMGIAIRAASDNADAARLLGVSVRRVSMITWGLGAGLAAIAGILIAPINGGLSIELLGTGLLLRALAAAIIGGLTSLPGALFGGLTVGIAEVLLTRYRGQGPVPDLAGLVEVVLFAGILIVLLALSRGAREEGELAFSPTIRKIPDWFRDHWTVGIPRTAGIITGIYLVLAVPLLLTPTGNFTFALMLVYAMLGVSLNLLMGTAGQISLGHFALLGVGAFTGARLITIAGMPFPLAFALAGLAGGAVAFLIGLPSLRIRGLYLAMATLAFAVAAEASLFRLDVFGARRGISLARPTIGPFNLDDPSGREMSYACLVALVAFVWLVRNIHRRRSGRALLAVRDNEKSAAVFGVSVRGYKLLAFTISGVLAAWAGFFYALLNPLVQFSAFSPLKSLELVAMVIIGGLGSVPGAVLGAAYVVGIPRMFPDSDIAPLLATGFGLLLVLMIRPGGLWSLLTGLRDFFVWALTVEDRAFKGPFSHLVPDDVPESHRLGSLFDDAETAETESAPELART
jgi:ABC-type branched-subunit amino acid transport system permease subunit